MGLFTEMSQYGHGASMSAIELLVSCLKSRAGYAFGFITLICLGQKNGES